MIPIRGSGPPEPPPYGGLGLDGWARGSSFLDFVEAAGAHRVALDAAFSSLRLDAETARFFAQYPRRSRILALGSVAEVDSRYNLPQAEFLFSRGPNLWMRIFDPESCHDLVQHYDVSGRGGLPLLVFFGDDRREFGRWGPRPRPLQSHPSLSDPADFEKSARAYYEGNGGADLAHELRQILSAHAGTPAA